MTEPRDDRGSPPSARVRLEAALLDGERGAPAPADAADERDGPTVLVVAAEADLRRYVRECLRERPALRLVEAATVAAAVALAARHSPACLVVDGPQRDVLAALPALGAVLLVDEVPRGPSGVSHLVRLLARPFSADALISELARLLGRGA